MQANRNTGIQSCRPLHTRSRKPELTSRSFWRGPEPAEEIVITKGHEPHARLLPPAGRGKRESVPLGHLHLPDDLFDGDDPEQAAIDAGDRNDALGIWRGRAAAS